MTEADYINATNLAKARSAMLILSSMLDDKQGRVKAITKALYAVIDDLEKIVKTDYDQ